MDHCFLPLVGPDTRLLVLGSLPGVRSLAEQRYYAHPRNQFWRLMSEVVGTDLVALDYAERLKTLANRRVGLWDTVASATRRGSLDADIRLHQASDIARLAATLPELRAIAFNGGTAAKIGRQALGPDGAVSLINLPSSSPALALAFAE
ncbi:MAG: DNA-deoxyinosine glycosylase, partial [Allosphingosinicella sp.]